MSYGQPYYPGSPSRVNLPAYQTTATPFNSPAPQPYYSPHTAANNGAGVGSPQVPPPSQPNAQTNNNTPNQSNQPVDPNTNQPNQPNQPHQPNPRAFDEQGRAYFLCGECNIPFDGVEEIEAHFFQTHQGRFDRNIDYFVCDSCDRALANARGLADHFRSRHGGAGPYRANLSNSNPYRDQQQPASPAQIPPTQGGSNAPQVPSPSSATPAGAAAAPYAAPYSAPHQNRFPTTAQFIIPEGCTGEPMQLPQGCHGFFFCGVCNLNFEGPGNLLAHFRKAHPNVDEKAGDFFCCDVCNRALSSLHGLLSHLRSVHPETRGLDDSFQKAQQQPQQPQQQPQQSQQPPIVPVPTLPPPETSSTPTAFACAKCPGIFFNQIADLTKHWHGVGGVHHELPSNAVMACGICRLGFSTPESLVLHGTSKHGIPVPEEEGVPLA